MSEDVDQQSTTPKGRRILALLSERIKKLLDPPPTSDEQRVTADEQRVIADRLATEAQRVIDDSPIITIP
jgi:hypothetical protein